MSVLTPKVAVTGASGSNLVDAWGSDLIGVTVTDHEGYESDEAVFRFLDLSTDVPAKGTPYSVSAWYEGGQSALAGAGSLFGLYTFSHVQFSGDPEEGTVKELVCRAADFIDKMKAAGSEHYDEENGHGTAGKIFQTLAKRAGVPAVVAPSLANLEIPYRLRWKQSPLDFATDLADEIGGIIKPQAGKLVVRERGDGLSVTGGDLPPVIMHRDPSYSFEANIEERTAHSETEGAWFDPLKGTFLQELASIGRAGGLSALMHPFASKVEAKRGAAAFAQQLSRFTGTGSFEGPGQAVALAGAPFIPVGYGSTIDNIEWVVGSVTHDIVPDQGWTMTVDVETREKTG